MIVKVYAFNEEAELLLRRVYSSDGDSRAVPDGEIRRRVKDACNSKLGCNMIQVTENTSIVFRSIEQFHICFVSSGENEMYVLSVLDQFCIFLEKLLGGLSEQLLTANFRDCCLLLDNYILNGKVLSMDSADVFNGISLRRS